MRERNEEKTDDMGKKRFGGGEVRSCRISHTVWFKDLSQFSCWLTYSSGRSRWSIIISDIYSGDGRRIPTEGWEPSNVTQTVQPLMHHSESAGFIVVIFCWLWCGDNCIFSLNSDPDLHMKVKLWRCSQDRCRQALTGRRDGNSESKRRYFSCHTSDLRLH